MGMSSSKSSIATGKGAKRKRSASQSGRTVSTLAAADAAPGTSSSGGVSSLAAAGAATPVATYGDRVATEAVDTSVRAMAREVANARFSGSLTPPAARDQGAKDTAGLKPNVGTAANKRLKVHDGMPSGEGENNGLQIVELPQPGPVAVSAEAPAVRSTAEPLPSDAPDGKRPAVRAQPRGLEGFRQKVCLSVLSAPIVCRLLVAEWGSLCRWQEYWTSSAT